jgi:UDP-4-amino-4,6-dideoxy-N-acetyl-beta-L-altrosamine transaminase
MFFFTPISVKTLSEQIDLLLTSDKSGIFNISSNERISKYHFGLIIAKIFGYSSKLIQPISIESLPNLVLRPKDMSLSNHKYTAALNIKLPSIDTQLEEMLNSQGEISEKRIIPYGRQNVSKKDIKSVIDVLKSDFLTQGPIVHQFEKKVSEYCGAKHAVACNSATSALHIACLSLGVGKGDIVWTSPISFVASSNCALYCNAEVDFVDIDPITYNMSLEALEQKLVFAKQNNRLPKVVIPVHLAGQSCEMAEIYSLSKKYGFKIIEDASHAIGGSYKGKPVGNCEFSDIAVFSFHPVKIITTCEGGMCLTNDPVLANLLNRYHSHGITRQASEMTKAPDGPWYYEQLDLGLNYRMNEVQAALGLSQMDRLDEFVKERRILAQKYNELLKEFDIQIPKQHKDTNSSWHLYIIRVKKSNKINHKQVFEKLRAAGILVNLHYIPIYRQPYYKKLGFNKQGFEESEKYYGEAISIPIFPGLTNDELRKVVSIIEQPLGFQNLF